MQMISHKAANKNSTTKHIKSIFKLSKKTINQSGQPDPNQIKILKKKKEDRDQTLAHFTADPQWNEKFYKKTRKRPIDVNKTQKRDRSRLKRRKTAIKRENNRGNRSKKERGDEIRRDLREETIAVLIE